LRLLTTLKNATSSQVSRSLAWVASFGPSVIDLIDASLKSHNRDSDDAGHGSTPTVKKPRLGKATTSHATSTSSGESYVEIGKKRRVTASVFKGQILVDIREYYGADGDEKPGKKGIALTVEQWEAIKSNIAAIDQLLSNVKK